MPVFRLEPIDADSPHWKRSWHRDACLVAAATEAEARERAAGIFDQVAKGTPGPEPLVAPWTDGDLVGCVLSPDVPHGMVEGMIALPDGQGGWQIRGRGADGTEVASG